MVLRIAAAFALISAATTIYFSGTQSYFEISHSVKINSNVDDIYQLLNDSAAWKLWSESVKTNGVQVEILSAALNQQVVAQVKYLKPLKLSFRYSFAIEKKDQNQVEVQVVCFSKLDLMLKILYRIFNVQRLIQQQMNQEIDELKRVAESKTNQTTR